MEPLHQQDFGLPTETSAPPDGEVYILPTSFAQQRLWFLSRLQPDSHAYNVFGGFLIQGALDRDALERSLAEIVRRHEILRTTFSLMDGEPVQVVSPEGRVRVAWIDLQDRDRAGSEREVHQCLGREARHVFDLAQGPLLRLTVLRRGAEEHVLIYVMHHIITDGWSEGIFVRELSVLYRAFSAGEPSPLPDLPIQYGDFAQWQRDWLQGDVLEDLLAGWRQKLAGAPTVLDLPADRPRPPVFSHRGAVERYAGGRDIASALKQLAVREDATLFATLLAAWGVLLSRLSGQDDLLIGSPIANRSSVEVEPLIGFFVGTLVLRIDLSGNPSFRQLLGRVRDAVYEAQERQDLPFERLMSELGLERDPSRNPLVQVFFTMDPPSREQADLGGLVLAPWRSKVRTAKFDLTLGLAETAHGLAGALEYCTDLFDAATIRRMLERFQILLEGIAEDPDRAIRDLPLLTPRERQALLCEWSGGSVSVRPEACLHELFAAQARRTPQATAVSCEGESLSYRELDRRAEILASRLGELLGGRPERVGICLERSLDMVVAILGALKAGAAYVPLDPAYPLERLDYLLSDSGVPVLVAGREALGELPGLRCAVMAIDSIDWNSPPAGGPSPGWSGGPGPEERPAYVIYTSGSTGEPKGVVVTHGNVVRLFRATEEWFHFGPGDTWSLFHSYAFDFSVWEIWGALLHGGRLVVVPYWASRSPEAFHRLLRETGVTVLSQTPSAFDQLIRADEAASGAGPALALRCVIFGGEALDPRKLAPWWARHGDRPRLVNMYGITETTVHVTYHELTAADLEPALGSPIGIPIPDLRLYVLGSDGRPAPLGVPGEIHVGGAGVAAGYLGRPDLTALRFVPDPFSDRPGARLYRSGDLARFRADGTLAFFGRADAQVKIHGFRIEPGEIEAALCTHPAVAEAVVLLRESGADKRLVAYVVLRPAAAVDVEELRAFLQDKLPVHMVPAAFVPLEKLPLTAHGKLDRKALPAPDPGRPLLRQEYVEPLGDVEETLATAWAEALGLDRVGVHDNFFTLGGDSIRSVHAVALARERGLEVSLQQVFQLPTIAELSREVRRKEGTGATALSAPFGLLSGEDRERLPEGLADAYPLTSLQAAMLYHRERMPESSIFHNVNSWRLRIPFDPEAFRRAVLYVTERHPILRTSFDLTGYSEPLQLVHQEPHFPVGVDDLRHLSESEQEKIVSGHFERQLKAPFDLSRPPQLRFHIHLRSGETAQLTLAENHAILDGWSLHTLLSEIFGVYSTLLRGEPLPAASPLDTTFRDFVLLERQALDSHQQREHWNRKLDGCAVLRVPRWREEIDLPVGKRCWRQDHLLPPDLTAALRDLAQTEAVSLKSVFLAAHCKVMGLLGGTSDVLTGLSSNGRPETPDGRRVCGLFLNTLPLRVGLGGGTWKDLVHAVHAEQLEMLPYRRYPLSAIQAYRGRERLLETSFVYLNFHVMDDAVQAHGLRAAGAAKFVEETNFVIMTSFTHGFGSQDRIVLNVTCDLTVLEEEQVRQIETYYLAALRAMAADPAARHDAVPLLSAAEMQVLTAEWSGAGKAAPEPGTVHERFEAQVDRNPEAVCVESAGRSLTFREVDARANRLAHRLRGLGIGPEARVALWLERSADLVIALLGVLKAGGAYLPVDPAFPAERVRFLLLDAGVSAVVAAESWRDRVPAGPMLPVLSLEETADGETAGRRASGGASAGHLAYVLYTSGSTGVPKGVGVEHRQLLAYLDGARERLDLPVGAVYAHMSTFSADLGNTVLFPPLCAGGTLRIVTEEQLRDPALAEGFAHRPVDCLKVVPSMLSALLEHPEGASILPRRRLILGGEAAGWKLIETVRRLAPQCRVFNHYGPTETTVGVVAGEITGMESPAGETGPRLGRPLGSARAYVLGPDRQPVPAGVPGELFVGGAGVSRGYIGRPDLTAERFLPDPFAGEPGARSYRTGDVVCWTPAGELEFLGRRDHQVKIRGFRVEISEIESILRRHPAVREAAVVARQEGQDRSLAAYVVPVPGHAPLAGELRRFLAEHLPAYMVPAAFVELREFPLTPNGKLDRQALPAPGELRPQERAESPKNPLQLQLLQLWGEVLGHRSFGIRDDFFEIGGNSLLAVRLVARLRKCFGQKLPLTALVEAGTVEKLSRVLQAGAPAAPAAHLVPLRPLGERLPLFCVHPGHGSVSSYLKLAHYLGPDQPFYGLQARDLDRDGDPYLSVEELAARYLAEVIATHPQGPYLLAGWSFGGLVAFEMAQQLRRQGREVLGLALIDTRTPAANARLVGIEPDLMKAYLLVEHAKNLAKLSVRDLPITPHDLLGLDLQEQLDRVLAAIDVRALLPEDVGTETIRRFLELRIARFQAIKNYVPAPYEGRITLFRATEVYTDTALGEAAKIFEDAARHPTYSWDEISLQPIDLRPVSGNHESVVYEPHVQELAVKMREFLDELTGSPAVAGATPEEA